MSFIENSMPKTTWAKISRGRIVLTSKDEKPGYTPRVNQLGNTVHEQFFEAFEGQLVSFRTNDSEYGCQYIFSFKDEDGFVNIALNCDSGYARNLMNRLLADNLDIKQVFRISPYQFQNNEGKSVSGLNIYQNGVKIEPKYKREDLPEAIKIVTKKNTTWNFAPIGDFLEEKFNEKILPNLNSTLPFIKKEASENADGSFIEKDIFDLDID